MQQEMDEVPRQGHQNTRTQFRTKDGWANQYKVASTHGRVPGNIDNHRERDREMAQIKHQKKGIDPLSKQSGVYGSAQYKYRNKYIMTSFKTTFTDTNLEERYTYIYIYHTKQHYTEIFKKELRYFGHLLKSRMKV